MSNSNIRNTVATAMLIAMCVVLPRAFHAVPRAGSILMPMHIPVLLAGLVCGWKFGLVAGITGPLLSHLFTGMPPAGTYQLMMIELGMYGLVSGLVLQFIRTKRASLDLYAALISAMLVGRVVAGIFQVLIFFTPRYIDGVWQATYTLGIWATSYFVTSVPGLVIQLAFVPSVVMALERERVIPLRYPIHA